MIFPIISNALYMIKKSSFIIGSVVLVSLFSWTAAFGQSSSSLDRIVDQIGSLFPPVEGYVVSLKEDELLLDLKQGDPIKPGDKLKLIRFGQELFHPVTGKKIGREETELGWVEIIRVSRNFSLAMLKDPGIEAKKGDGVRLPFQRVSFLVAPVEVRTKKKVDKDELIFQIEKKLKGHRRFDVPAFDLRVWMLKNGVKTQALTHPANLKNLNKKVAADFIFFPTVSAVKKKTILSYRLVSMKDGEVVKQAEVLSDDVPTLLSKKDQRARARGTQTDLRTREEGPVRYRSRQEFMFEIVDFDIGDLNGDGKLEYVIIDRYRVMIFNYENDKFKKVAQVKMDKVASHFLSVDIADINNNGRDEIFVTNQYGMALHSFALEANPKRKGFQKTWEEVNYYFRVIKPFGSKPKLLAQSPGYNTAFSSGIKTILFRKGRYVDGPDLELPSIYGTLFTLYGMTQADVTRNKSMEIIILDNNYHLRVYSASGRVLVQSDDYFGHDPRPLEVGVIEELPGIEDEVEITRFKNRLRLVRNGSARYLVLPRNHRFGGNLMDRMVIVNNCSLVFFGIDKEGFDRAFETKKQKGYLAGYQVTKDPKTKDMRVHMVAVEVTGLVAKTKISTVYTYDWMAN